MKEKTIELKVIESMQDDAYKGIARIDSETMKEIGQDSEMKKKLNEVKRKFESLNKEEIDEKFLQNVLKFQKLAYELEN